MALRILSIIAFKDDGQWSWDSWRDVGTVEPTFFDLSTRGQLKYLRDELYLRRASVGKVAIEDDQYNLVVVDRATREPLFAVEYGCEQ